MPSLAPLALLALLTLPAAAASAPPRALSPQERLGKKLFFDDDLSANRNQSCATCHALGFGTTGPTSAVNALGGVYEGSVPGRFGNRKPPAAAYAGDSPRLHFDAAEKTWVGGMFWDGRSTGELLGDPLAEQAQGPFLNPLEHGLAGAPELVKRVCTARYAAEFRSVWGKEACAGNVELDYARIGRSIAAYERSREVSPFSSKYDAVLAGKARLSPQEAAGLAVFVGPGKCAGCHPSDRGPRGEPPLFTDFTYDNLGVPRNPMNPFAYQAEANPAGAGWADEGLGAFLRQRGDPPAVFEPELGKFKVPTLRNVDLRPRPQAMVAGEVVKAYGHNGYFKSLREVVHFYNTRDALPSCAPGSPGEKVSCWPAPEVPRNVNKDEMGNLALTAQQEADLVAFLRTLSDGWTP